MKKYLMTGIAALAMSGLFISCGPDMSLYNGNQSEQVVQNYEDKFVQAFGEPAPNQTWGFGSSTVAGTRGMTRTITVNGDAYDKFPSTSDVAEYFPTAIPADAKTDAELEAEWKGKYAVDENGEEIIAWGNKVQMWDMYAIYLNMVGRVIKNIKVTAPGEYTVGQSWANPSARVYNVYISVGEGNSLTLKRNGAEHVNFYIMSGIITIDSNFGECGGIISVAEGATVNDQRSHLAHNDGIKVYNRGTYNSVNTNNYWNGSKYVTFDIGNNCTFYNEGKFTSGDLSYSPGDANTSYFVNLGDNAEITASSMTLNSAGNFFNSGKAVIAGETNVTQKDIYWVNSGHYTTGTMTFSAKNATFYNYCQLFITGNAHMYDGELNLMNNSYTEAATAEFNNFIVNMGSNSGINIKGATDWKAQGDGTYQGFRVFDGASGSYVRLGGKATVASHKRTLSISSGITYNIKEIEIIKNGNVVTEQQLKDNQDGDYPVLDLNGTKAESLTVTPNTNSCGATWSTGGGGDPQPGPQPGAVTVTDSIRVIGEDLTINSNSDFDFNDIVFDVYWTYALGSSKENQTVKIKFLAAGGELPIYIGPDEESAWELHGLFADKEKEVYGESRRRITTKTMMNTAKDEQGSVIRNAYECPEKVLPNSWWSGGNIQDIANSIEIRVQKSGTLFVLKAPEGKAPSKIAVDTDYNWCGERDNINTIYGKFNDYVEHNSYAWNEWYK